MQRVALSLLVVAACGGDEPCDPMTEACTFERDVSTIEVAAGREDEDLCQSWTLNNPTELWVDGITQHNDGGYHHANWFFTGDHNFPLPDGAWSCSAENFDEVTTGIQGGFLFALSTQAHDETQTLPKGAAIRIPPYSRVIGSSHLLNPSDSSVTTTMHVSIHTVPPKQVTDKVAPARLSYYDLHIDPSARSSFSMDCDIAAGYHDARPTGTFFYKLVYVLAHYHALGSYQQLQILGGPRDGEVIVRHEGYGDNAGHAIEPGVDLVAAGARGVRFTCGFTNPRAAEVGWGIGDQEMCVMALQAVTDIAFVGDVNRGTGQKIGAAPDGEIRYQGPCAMTAFPWDFNKPGGKGH